MSLAADRRATPLFAWLTAFAGYALLTVLVTWPIPARIGSAFPHDNGDPGFTTWILWWNAHALPLTSSWWSAPLFWPAPDMFALSEHMLGISLVTTPLQWIGLSPIAAFNVAFLLSFPLSAIAAHALAYSLTRRHDASVLAALVFGFSPYRISQLPHLQMLWAFGMPLALASLHWFVETGRRGWLVVFALAWLVQALANGYFMLFFPVLLGGWLLWFTARGALGDAFGIAMAFAVGCLPLVPFVIGYEQIHRHLNLERHINEIELFSADITGIIAASPAMRVWHPLSRFSSAEGELFPGAFAVILAAAGVVAAVIGHRRSTRDDPVRTLRRGLWSAAAIVGALAISPLMFGAWKLSIAGRVLLSVAATPKPLTVACLLAAISLLLTPTVADAWRRGSALGFYAAATVVMLIFSFGPRPRFNGTVLLFRAPYEWLMMLVPGFSSVRVPARFAMLAILCLAATAALAFDRLTRRLTASSRLALACAAAALVIVESAPKIAVAAPADPIPALGRGDVRGAVLELPIGITDRDIAALYRSMGHGHPTVNGYSGYDPPHYLSLQLALAAGDEGVLDTIAAGQPLTVAVDHRWDFAQWAAFVERHPAHRQLSDDGAWRVYEVTPRARVEIPSGGRLPVASVTPNLRPQDAALMLDGALRTNWNSGQRQTGNEDITIDLGRDRDVAAVRMELGPYRYDFPRALTVECAADGGTWDICWRGSAAAVAVRGVLDDPVAAPMMLPIGRQTVRRIRLHQTATDRFNGWSIAELIVLGR